MIQQVGITTDGKPVIAGIGILYFQEGTPLSISFDCCIKKGLVPSWNHLVKELSDNGMSMNRIAHLLNEHIHDSYGKEYRNIIMGRLGLVV